MGFLEDRNLDDVPNIPEYYKGKTIFITGGSGFMGKVLVEKLLYSCSDLDRIYLLLRSKKGVKPEDRLAELYSSKCFDRLRKERPGLYEKKVFFIAGDVSENGLGICAEDRTLIVNRTHIIFHVAACVRFDQQLKSAVLLNLRGTRDIIELAKEISHLEVLIHVSTAYANTNKEPLQEIMYPPYADWRETLEICENVDTWTLNALTHKLLGELPNTYAYTKQLAEHVVYEQRGKLPVVIMRPSIVISSYKEPVPGWIENLNGPIGLMIASGKGVLRTFYADPDLISDYMPVDVCTQIFIAGAWARGTKKLMPTDDIDIYNCSSNHPKAFTLGEVIECGKKIVRKIPLEGMLWCAGGSLTKSKFEYVFKMLFCQLLPAIFIDALLMITGNKPILFKIQRRIYVANLAIDCYITRQWTFPNDNIRDLREKIKHEDRKHFYYEIETVVPETYFMKAVIGVKEYILNERMENLPKAKLYYRRMELLDRVVRFAVLACMFWFICNIGFVKNFLESIQNYL